MENVRMLAFRKSPKMPVEIWANVELVLKNANLKFHKHTVPKVNRDNYEIIYRIDSKALNLDEILLIVQELSNHYRIDSLCYDPGRTTLANPVLYPETACQITLALEHN